MAELKNHRQAWTNEEDQLLIQTVITSIEDGKTQRDAFRFVGEKIGRTMGAIEYHWKKIRKEQETIQEQFQGAVAYALIDAVNHPQNSQDDAQGEDPDISEITKGATQIHRMIKQIIKPGTGITLPKMVAEELNDILAFHPPYSAYDREFLVFSGYKTILSYIDGKPKQARKYFRAIEEGFEIELTQHQKIRSVYETLKLIKSNEPGYMIARGMIVMMYHTMDILDKDAVNMMGIERDMPF